MLEKNGVTVAKPEELEAIAASATAQAPVTVFIRAHGICRDTRKTLETLAARYSGFSFVDCTCPFVTKIHRIASECSEGEGRERHIFLCIGNATHPEVEGFSSCFDGEKYSVKIPEALRPYMGGKEIIEQK